MALFDLEKSDAPVAIAPTPHMSDDIAAKKLADNVWEIAVSGCWESSFSKFQLSVGEYPAFKLIATKRRPDHSFCHGVAYDGDGDLWLSVHTGHRPRIEVDGCFWSIDRPWFLLKHLKNRYAWQVRKPWKRNLLWRLPEPWGPRDICFEKETNNAYAIAVSNNPKLTPYEHTSTSIWSLNRRNRTWSLIKVIENMHSDAGAIHDGLLWMPDQLNDRVIALDLSTHEVVHTVQGEHFDFPHGLGISPSGVIAVTNYGNSTVTIVRP